MIVCGGSTTCQARISDFTASNANPTNALVELKIDGTKTFYVTSLCESENAPSLFGVKVNDGNFTIVVMKADPENEGQIIVSDLLGINSSKLDNYPITSMVYRYTDSSLFFATKTAIYRVTVEFNSEGTYLKQDLERIYSSYGIMDSSTISKLTLLKHDAFIDDTNDLLVFMH